MHIYILDENNYHLYRHDHTFRATLYLLYLRPLGAPVHNPYIYLCMYAHQEKCIPLKVQSQEFLQEGESLRGNKMTVSVATFTLLL